MYNTQDNMSLLESSDFSNVGCEKCNLPERQDKLLNEMKKKFQDTKVEPLKKKTEKAEHEKFENSIRNLRGKTHRQNLRDKEENHSC